MQSKYVAEQAKTSWDLANKSKIFTKLRILEGKRNSASGSALK
jgi:hypothetical protein